MVNPQIILDAYLIAALWSSVDDNGDPLDKNYSIDDIEESTISQARTDIAFFITKCKDIDLSQFDNAHIGHDFWLTRNHHGAGFWDGDYPEPQATQLTTISHSFPSIDPMISDSNKVYFE